MKIIKAEAMGLCFGVRDALRATLAREDASEITIQGELVHNEEILERLREHGYRQSPEGEHESEPQTEKVLITAHGVSDRERKRLEARDHDLIDTTCPLVKRIHEAARNLHREGYLVIVIGKPGHVEVNGIVGDLEHFRIVSRSAEVRRYPHARIGVVCQSTFRLDEAHTILAEIKAENAAAEVRFVETVCDPTKDRINAARKVAAEVDVMIVVGGLHSNNTRELAALCQQEGARTYHIQGPRDLDPRWFEHTQSVGLTAGTSTLDTTVDMVYDALCLVNQPAQRATA